MAGHRTPGPVCEGSASVYTRHGTLCLANLLPPAPIGTGEFQHMGADLTVAAAWVKHAVTPFAWRWGLDLGDGAHWGVDSSVASNAPVGGARGPHHHRKTLFEHIATLARRKPEFWGRYIGGYYALTASEADFLLGNGCSILVIYNGAYDGAKSVRGGYQEGVKDANKAIAAATALSVPDHTYIYADIESGWRVTAKWLEGWSDTMHDSDFGGAGGVYANPMPSNAPRFNTPYCQAFNSDEKMRGSDGVRGGYIYSSEPEPGCGRAPGKYAPAAPPCNPNAVIWQYAEGCYSGLVDQDLANDIGFWSMWR
ncbi:MAG TPA: glycoside hydrolase domain-containing protein [Terriglobia bacterium]|nr:glycoside hydrolase domain-containing protein [Terriglobia bacterium]